MCVNDKPEARLPSGSPVPIMLCRYPPATGELGSCVTGRRMNLTDNREWARRQRVGKATDAYSRRSERGRAGWPLRACRVPPSRQLTREPGEFLISKRVDTQNKLGGLVTILITNKMCFCKYPER